MSDQQMGVTFQPKAGQPAGEPSEQVPEQGAPTTNYLTRDDFETEWEKRAKELEDAAFRRAQSLYDKGNQKVRAKLAEVEASVKRAQKAGVQIAPETIEKMRQDALQEAYLEEEAQPSAPVTQAPAQEPAKPQPQDALDPVNAMALRMQEKAGVMLYDSDPEVAAIKAAPDEVEFLEAVRAGIQAKQQRMARSPEARMAGLGAGSSGSGGLDAQYQAELAKIPRGHQGTMARSALKAKYRAKGLDII